MSKKPEIVASANTISLSNDLYLYHLISELSDHGIRLPNVIQRRSESTPEPRYSCTLRTIADQFNDSIQRQWVHEQAQNVDLTTLNLHTFNELLSGLFAEGEVTWERILVLFYFCTDISVRALQERLIDCFCRIYIWTTSYITSRLAVFVEEHGGWVKILCESMDYLTTLCFLGVVCVGVLALIVYIKTSDK